ncbi:MAG: glycosyltransferase family 9 protein [Nitrospirae bacterium]|nr:glycosyltransferase family 9 protein [Nitrospirota bacterium]
MPTLKAQRTTDESIHLLSGQKVLLVQTAYPGDVLFCLPLAVALKAKEPGIRLIGVTSREAADVWQGQPCFQDVVVWDKRGKERNPVDMIRLAGRLRRMRPDIAVVAHTSAASAVLARLSGAAERIGFRKGPGSFLHTRRLEFPKDTFEGRYRDFYPLLGLRLPPDGMIFTVSDVPLGRARKILSEEGWFEAKQRIAITFGSKIATKKWPDEKWADLLKRLSGEPSTRMILLGTSGETEEAERIRSGAPNHVTNLTGLTVQESAAALQSATWVIGVDSFGLHLARFLGVPSIGIFGPTDPKALTWRPNQKPVFVEDLPCRPCTVFHAPHRCPKGHHNCMNLLEATQVVRVMF